MTVYVREYADVGVTFGKHIQAAKEPGLADQTIANAATAAASSAFNDHTRVVRVHTDTAIGILFGAAPTALTTSAKMAADTTEYFVVEPGHKLSVINI